MDLELAGKRAVITGGSGEIGKEIAYALAREDANIALVARDIVRAEAVAETIPVSSRRQAKAFRADTGSDEQVRECFTQIAGAFGGIDILINCAAQPASSKPEPTGSNNSGQDLLNEINVKVLGYLRCAEAAVPYMRKGGWGRIINVSGMNARLTGSITGSIRNVAVVSLTKNLAAQLGRYGVNVTCIHPALTRTERLIAQISAQSEKTGQSCEEIEAEMIRTHSLIGRLVTAAEIANVVAFLSSPKSIPINGDVIPVGGGLPGVIYY